MPFIPHTREDIQAMLATIGVSNIEQLFEEIPNTIASVNLDSIPEGLKEWQVRRLMQERESNLIPGGCFLGAGAYEHHIPAAVWEIASRGEFLTAYTPYQAEASQGTLQLIYEYQTMMAQLMGMDVSNASLYDGASALAEAILMALRIKKNKNKRVWIPKNLHPRYRQVLSTVLKHQEVVLEELNFDSKQGNIDFNFLSTMNTENLAAIVIPQPNFLGVLEDVDQLTNFAHQHEALAIAVVNPIAMALLKEPGKWGKLGADIVCGEGQPLGVPLASGGPYFGFMCCKKQFVRQLPGRIVGRTVDHAEREGFTLTLQAREQHIRRAKATSNICTNQGLLVTAATIYMSILGPQGLRSAAAACHYNALDLCERVTSIEGVDKVFARPLFHEFVISLPVDAELIVSRLAEHGIQAGYPLGLDYPELKNCLLVCTTETKSTQDLVRYQQRLAQCLQ